MHLKFRNLRLIFFIFFKQVLKS
ncbi:hypothetical protein MCP1_8500002 [Candidatus Terasakiella magnetica]|nr:hypothetical protein MCP1_8500002 [Candidatus Terasakiella magnetica]